MTNAFDVKDYQIARPGWLDTEWFAIEATMQPETTKEQFREMGPNGVPLSQQKAIVHLTVLPGPPPPAYRWVGWQATFSDLAKDLTDELHRPVTDATALTAKYNFTLNFSRDPLTADASAQGEPLPNIFSALQSIGLKLEEKKEPVTVIVIDHAEKTPTEN